MRISFVVSAMLLASIGLDSMTPTAPSPAGHVTGLGGVIVVSRNPKALSHWYRDMLGVMIQPWGGIQFAPDAPGHPPYVLWSAFKQSASEFKGTTRDFFLTLTVDNLDAIVARLKRRHVPILKREADPYGRYATIIDPEGTKLELWQPVNK